MRIWRKLGLPTWESEIVSQKSGRDVADALRAVTGEHLPYKKEFLGSVHDDRFSIRPVIYYKNSFLPVIDGEIGKSASGTVIRVTMQINPGGATALRFLMLIMVFAFVVGVGWSLAGGFAEAWQLLVISPVLFAITQLMMRLGFHFPAKIALARLEELLK